MTPEFSVIIPFHNNERTIASTLASVLWQKGATFEIIIVDDRSTSAARDHLMSFVSRHSTLARVIDAEGEGVSAARNTGAAHATGAYNWFLDADDCMAPDALARVAAAFSKNRDLGVTFGRVRISSDPEKDNGGTVTRSINDVSLPHILGENCVCTASNIAVRHEAFNDIREFNRTLTHAEDQEWLVRAYLSPKWKLQGLPFITVHYRTSIGGLSTDLKKMESGWRAILALHNDQIARISLRERRQTKALFYRYLARRALRLGQDRMQALGYFLTALYYYPPILIGDCRRTAATGMAAIAVACFGHGPFRKLTA